MARTYRLGFARRAFNRAATAAIGLPIPVAPRHVYLLTVPGRRTGTPHTTPVQLVEDGSARWLVAPYGEVQWVRNARAAGEVTLRRGRRRERLRVDPVDATESGPVLKRYAKEVRVTRPFFDASVGDPPEAFAAEADRHPVFRLVGA